MSGFPFSTTFEVAETRRRGSTECGGKAARQISIRSS